jgi:hypothetical protein
MGEESILTECSNEAYGDIVVPDGVTQIAEGAFKGCEKITGITIPNCVQRIGLNAFYGCKSLIILDIPKASISIIGGKKFIGRFILTALD